MTTRKRLSDEEKELQEAKITQAVREFDIEFGGIPEYKAPDPVIVYGIEFHIEIEYMDTQAEDDGYYVRPIPSQLQSLDRSWLSHAASMFNKLSRSEKLAWLKKTYPKHFKLKRGEVIVCFNGTFEATVEEYELRMQ